MFANSKQTTMNVLKSAFRLPRGLGCSTCSVVMQQAAPLLRAASSWILSRTPAACAVAGRGALGPGAEGAGIFRNLPWRYQQVRSVKRGAEYQPKNIKRMRTHGWDRRVRTRGGIEVILRRMLKGRKSLTV